MSAIMVLNKPDDGTGNTYHVVDLNGNTVLAYKDVYTAINSMEGDQRLFIQGALGKWVGSKPMPDADVAIEKLKRPINDLVMECRFVHEKCAGILAPGALGDKAKALVAAYNHCTIIGA